MQCRPTRLPGIIEIQPVHHGDVRGYFCEIFRAGWFEANVARVNFVQENESLSCKAGVIRGLHFQSAPFAQGKLVRCPVGAIFDVAVDIREGSPAFGKWVSVILAADQGNQLWVPPGFLHGFCTLTPDTLVSYKVTAYYSREHEFGVSWNDPELAIEWPDIADPALLSEKDAQQPLFKDLPLYFAYSDKD